MEEFAIHCRESDYKFAKFVEVKIYAERPRTAIRLYVYWVSEQFADQFTDLGNDPFVEDSIYSYLYLLVNVYSRLRVEFLEKT